MTDNADFHCGVNQSRASSKNTLTPAILCNCKQAFVRAMLIHSKLSKGSEDFVASITLFTRFH